MKENEYPSHHPHPKTPLRRWLCAEYSQALDENPYPPPPYCSVTHWVSSDYESFVVQLTTSVA
jgi:hypothetical protein